MICECCGSEISELDNNMYICNNCFSVYIAGEHGEVLAKHITNGAFQEIYKSNKHIFINGSDSDKKKLCESLITSYRGNPAVWNTLGVIYRGENRIEEAEKCYQEALSLNPKYTQVMMNLGILRIFQKRYDEACSYLSKAKQYMDKINGNYPTLIANYGYALGLKGDLGKAEDMIDEAEKLGYGNAGILRKNLGIKSDSYSVGGFFSKMKGGINKAREDAAVRKAYREEEEKRKPHIKQIKHERPLTPAEQLAIDQLEAEAASKAFELGQSGKNIWVSIRVPFLPSPFSSFFPLRKKAKRKKQRKDKERYTPIIYLLSYPSILQFSLVLSVIGQTGRDGQITKNNARQGGKEHLCNRKICKWTS